MRDELGRFKAVNGKKQEKKNEKNRHRNQIINFHATPEEHARIEAKAMLCEMPKGDFYLNSIMGQKMTITAGKYKSERLAVEVKRLRESIDNIVVNTEDDELYYVLLKCKGLMEEFITLVCDNPNCVDEANYKAFEEVVEKKNVPAGNKDIQE